MPANNEIWYTSSDGNIVTPYNTNVFGVNIVSNTYSDGKGVITFDGDITTIGEYAFYDCYSLTGVTIPDSVTSIGKEAFRACASLTSVYCKAITPPVLGGYSVFDYNGSGRMIYVPTESVNVYRIAVYWSTYSSLIVGYDF